MNNQLFWIHPQLRVEIPKMWINCVESNSENRQQTYKKKPHANIFDWFCHTQNDAFEYSKCVLRKWQCS